MSSTASGIEATSLATAGTILDQGFGKHGSNLRVWPSSYVLLGTESATVTLTMLTWPKGIVPLGGYIWASADQGASATFAVGITGTTGKYLAATVLHSAMVGGPSGGFSFSTANGLFLFGDTNAAGMQHARLTADETILVTIASASPAAGSLFLTMFGMMPGTMGA
jgi:hypothetical protein